MVLLRLPPRPLLPRLIAETIQEARVSSPFQVEMVAGIATSLEARTIPSPVSVPRPAPPARWSLHCSLLVLPVPLPPWSNRLPGPATPTLQCFSGPVSGPAEGRRGGGFSRSEKTADVKPPHQEVPGSCGNPCKRN